MQSLPPIELVLPKGPNCLARVRDLIAKLGRELAFTRQEVDSLKVAVCEALSNAARHASCEKILVRVNPNGKGITVEVIDGGQGFKFRKSLRRFPAPGVPNGRGIPLMTALVDEAEFQTEPGAGTKVKLTKYHKASRTRSHP